MLVDVRKPLRSWIYTGSPEFGRLWIQFLYERLSDFYYNCGRLGLLDTNCGFTPCTIHPLEPKATFGPWMRSLPNLNSYAGSQYVHHIRDSSIQTNIYRDKINRFDREEELQAGGGIIGEEVE